MSQTPFDTPVSARAGDGSIFSTAGQQAGEKLAADSQTAIPKGSDQAAVPGADSNSQQAATNKQVTQMLTDAKQLRANVVRPGEVISIDELNLNRRPAWNPHAIQKGPVDTVDDLTLASE
jgi:hypothetical protein